MIIEGITLRPHFENAYILGDERTKRAIVVDPGAEPERVLAALDRQGLTAKLILCTHGHIHHIHHISAVTPVRQSTGALFSTSSTATPNSFSRASVIRYCPSPMPPRSAPGTAPSPPSGTNARTTAIYWKWTASSQAS